MVAEIGILLQSSVVINSEAARRATAMGSECNIATYSSAPDFATIIMGKRDDDPQLEWVGGFAMSDVKKRAADLIETATDYIPDSPDQEGSTRQSRQRLANDVVTNVTPVALTMVGLFKQSREMTDCYSYDWEAFAKAADKAHTKVREELSVDDFDDETVDQAVIDNADQALHFTRSLLAFFTEEVPENDNTIADFMSVVCGVFEHTLLMDDPECELAATLSNINNTSFRKITEAA